MREIDPNKTSRARAFQMWIKSPMPMVTITKTFRIDRLVRLSKRKGWKLNVLMCWCIGKTASTIPEFFMLPVDEKLMLFDRLAINVVVKTQNGGINTCDVPYSDDIRQFSEDYLRLTQQVRATDQAYNLGDDYAIIGTSTLSDLEADSFVNQYSGIFNNPFLVWGKYRNGLFKKTLPISFQFHHAQMDGMEAVAFLNGLQKEMESMSV